MTTYFASPNTQQQAQAVAGKPVLLSFAFYPNWMYPYASTFSRLLIDSGAYSEMNSGKKVDIDAYKDWSQQWLGHADAVAGLDDIRGDWRRGMANFQHIPWTFPTWHDSDPPELIDELAAMARERNTWIGIGLVPPREGKESIVRMFCDRVPEDLHVHGWALRRYANIRRIDSVDSTNWWRDAMKYCSRDAWLTYGQALQMVMWRYEQEPRRMFAPGKEPETVTDNQLSLMS